MKIEELPIEEIKPYKNNPRKNKDGVDIIEKSIKEFGFQNPIILDKNNEIIAGHTRLLAAKKLKMKKVPIIRAENLTEKQVKAFRIMDNKSQEYSLWDYNLLKQEILGLEDLNFDIELTGFTEDEINFFNPDTDKPANNAYDEWRNSEGIEYGNEDKTGVKTILVHFENIEAVKKFSKMLNQPITSKTKYLWFPKQSEDKVANLKYEEQ